MAVKMTFFNGYDNAGDVVCKKSGAGYDVSSATKIMLEEENGAFSLDSSVDSDVFIYSGLDYTGQVKLMLGHQSIPDGKYLARLIVVDSTYLNGLVFDGIELEFITP